MIDYFFHLNFVYQALIAGVFTWLITLLGAMLVYFFKNVDNFVMNLMLALSAGVMISASFFSLLLPALEQSNNSWFLPSLGFIIGGIFLYILDKAFKKLVKSSTSSSSILLVFSITMHNIPEGMAIGIAFGSLSAGDSSVAAMMLAIGIGIQNFPEGAAVSLPLRRNGMKTRNAFLIGQLSGIVEPISALLGALLAAKLVHIQPFALAFAAGAMIYVVVAELIPESQKKESGLVTLFTLIGFIIMMILDVAFS